MNLVTLPNGVEVDLDGDLSMQSIDGYQFIGECLVVTGGTQTMETLSNGVEVVRTSQHTLSGMTIQQEFVYLDEGLESCDGVFVLSRSLTIIE